MQGAAAATDAAEQTISQFADVLVITVSIIMASLIAYSSAAINAEERTREHATMFAYGVGIARVIRGNLDVSMRNTMPDLGTLLSISALTYALAALAGVAAVALAPLLTLKRLRRTDIPSALRVVE